MMWLIIPLSLIPNIAWASNKIEDYGIGSMDEAISTIKKDLAAQMRDMENTVDCYLSDSEECELSEMSDETSTLVYPGGTTRCIYADSTPFRFQVVRGDPKKLLFYFQGGGACWNQASTDLGLCTTDATPSSLNGMFSRDAEQNPDYYDHTFIQVLYCSGDAHSGNSTRPYNERGTDNPVVQVGARNTIAVLDWLAAQSLGELDELIVAGCSAGSIGAQMWADWIISTVPAKETSVIFDSFTGLFPPTSQGPVIKEFGVCDSVILDAWPELEARCNADELTLQDVVANTLQAHPNQVLSHINSKTDIVQQSYYVLIGMLNRSLDAFITPIQYYEGINQIYERYHAYPNHVAFLVDSSMHCYTNNAFYYTADTNGLSGSDENSEKMYNWVGSMPLGNNDGHGDGNLTWACAGEHMALDDAVASRTRPSDYCDEALTDRVIDAPTSLN